jgi:hypothetical protein
MNIEKPAEVMILRQAFVKNINYNSYFRNIKMPTAVDRHAIIIEFIKINGNISGDTDTLILNDIQ